MKSSERTIGEIVSEDFRTAKVFENRGIDFCCGGSISLAATCIREKIDLAEITDEIEAVKKEPLERAMNFASWGLPFLADYINNVHHFYLKENTGRVSAYGKKIAATHGYRLTDMEKKFIVSTCTTSCQPTGYAWAIFEPCL